MRFSGGNQHLQTQRFNLLHEFQMGLVVTLPALLQTFFFDQGQPFV